MKMKFLIKVPVVYLMVFCCILSLSDGQENDQGNVPDNPNAETAQFHKDRSQERRHLLAHLADRMDLDGEGLRHIQKHMGELTGDSTDNNKDIQDVADGDNVKGIFYFFKLHDYDNNQKLDGLEWMKALTDFHQDDKEKGKDFQAGGAMFLEHEAEAIVDELLKKHDANDDGMIDFIELMNSRVESLMTDLDKAQPDDQGGAHEEGHQEQNQESLENEYNQQQQGQDSPSLQEEYNQQQHQEQGNDDQQQQQQQHDSEQPQEQQQQQQQHDLNQPQEQQQQQQQQQGNDQQENQQNSDQLQEDQSLEQEFNQQQQQQDSEQQQENDQQENQQDSEQPHEPSLEEQYNQQH